MEITGERTVPGVEHENYWFRRHEVVYEWLLAYVSGARVLEAGAGEGYGAGLMSRLAASVVALDFDATAATHAAATYPGVPAVRGNLVRLPFADSSFDLVVSLQTVEHLWDQEAAWEPRHGDLVRAQLASGAPAAWDRDLRQLVASVSTADFEVDAAHDSCLDLVAVVTRPTEPEQG